MKALPLLAALVALSTPAHASDAPEALDARTAEAKAQFKQGVQLYKQARYGEAVETFETAYRLKPHGVVRFNVAQCYEKLGEVGKALASYHLYLREVPQAEDAAAVRAAMAGLEKRLAERGVQQLLVFSTPPNARLAIDQHPTGATPWAGELPLGRHALALELAGHEPASREVELGAASSVVLEVTLPAAPVVGVEVPKSAPDAPIPAAKAEASPPPRRWTWVVAGAAAASLVAAVGCGIAAQSASDQMRSAPHDRQTVQGLHDRAASTQTAANVLYGVGAAAGVAGGVLFFTGRF